MDRSPSVAGFFYPSDPNVLRKLLDELFLEHPLGPKKRPEGDEKTIGILAPHAGYIYSGPCAAHAYTKLPKVDTLVIIGPNHTGLGNPLSVRPDGKRLTPIGSLEVDSDFVELLVSRSPLKKDYHAHLEEHSIEVQLPFVIYVYEQNGRDLPKIVPIALGYQGPDVAAEIAKAIFETSKEYDGRIALIASSDLNHYEPHSVTVAKDEAVLRYIEALDVEGFYRTIAELNVSVCGYGAIATAMNYTRLMGGGAKKLFHMTSGDVTGEHDTVVGYGAVRFYLR